MNYIDMCTYLPHLKSLNTLLQQGTVHLTRSRSMNSVNIVHSPEVKRTSRPQLFLDKNIANKLKIRSGTTPERSEFRRGTACVGCFLYTPITLRFLQATECNFLPDKF